MSKAFCSLLLKLYQRRWPPGAKLCLNLSFGSILTSWLSLPLTSFCSLSMSFLATWRFWPRSLTTRWKLRQRWREIAKTTRKGRTWKQKDLILCCQIYHTEGAGNEKIKMLIERSNPFEREMYLPQELRLFNLKLLSLKKLGEEIDKKNAKGHSPPS